MSRESVFTVEAPTDWINSNQRVHRMVVAKRTALWREAAREKILAAGWEPHVGKVHILAHIWKPRGGRYDPNNLWPTVKAAVDGIVSAGFITDDDHEHVLGPDMRHGGKGAPALVITIREVP